MCALGSGCCDQFIAAAFPRLCRLSRALDHRHQGFQLLSGWMKDELTATEITTPSQMFHCTFDKRLQQQRSLQRGH